MTEKKKKPVKKKEAKPKAEEKKQALPAEKEKKDEEKQPVKKSEKQAMEKKPEDGKKQEKPSKEKKPVKKKRVIEKIKNPPKSKEIKALSGLVKKKPRRMFRGRFGQRNCVRNISHEKWQKWRKPRGMDIKFKREDGRVVKIGYRTPKKIRGIHPSGFREIVVRNPAELVSASRDKNSAVKIAGTVGLKKRDVMLKKAKELKVFVLNP